jgi:hypothetical protein
MSRLLRNLLAAGAATTVALALVPSPAGATAPGPTSTTNKAKGAAGWLAQQLIDGNHLVYAFDGKTVDYGGTEDLLYALASAGVGKSTIRTVLTYLRKNVADPNYLDIKNEDGYGPYDGSIGKAAVATQVAGGTATTFGGYNLLQQLKTDECTATSASCVGPGAAANIFSSISESLVITAEARGAAVSTNYAPSANAIEYFRSLQCTDGGFTSNTTGGAGCTSDVDATGYAIMALQALGGQSTAIGKAATWLESKRNGDGSWTSNGGENIDSTGLAVAGLKAAGRSTATSVAWLRSQQVTTGPTAGAGATRGALKYEGKFDAASSVKGTSDGLLGITRSSLATLTDASARNDLPLLKLATPHVMHAKVKSGNPQRVRGTGFANKELVVATVNGLRLGSAKSNANGTVHVTFTVRKSLSAWKHTVLLTGHRTGLEATASFLIRK